MMNDLPLRKVELIPAYEWTCDECGKRNFESGVVPELSEEERADLCEEHGIEVFDSGDWMLMPTHVECEHCGVEFAAEHFGQGDSDDE